MTRLVKGREKSNVFEEYSAVGAKSLAGFANQPVSFLPPMHQPRLLERLRRRYFVIGGDEVATVCATKKGAEAISGDLCQMEGGWVSTYRTLLTAPDFELRQLLEQVATFRSTSE